MNSLNYTQMETNGTIIYIAMIFSIILISFLMRRNLRDQKDLKDFLNEEVKCKERNEINKNI